MASFVLLHPSAHLVSFIISRVGDASAHLEVIGMGLPVFLLITAQPLSSITIKLKDASATQEQPGMEIYVKYPVLETR